MGIPAGIGVAAAGLPNAGDQANAVVSGQITAVGPTAPFACRGPMNAAIWNSINTALTTTKGSLAATVASATGLAAGNAINSINVPDGTTIGALAGTNVTLALPPVTYPASGANTINGGVTLPPGSNVAALLGATVTVPSTGNANGFGTATLPAGTTVVAINQTDIAPSSNSPGRPGIIVLSNAFTVVQSNNLPVPLQFAPTGNAITTTGADAKATFTGALVTWDATVQLERSFDGGSTFIVCNIGGTGTLAQYLDLASVSLTFGEPEKEVLYRLNCIEYTSGTINYRISQTGGAAESLAIGPLTSG
jgi:hypothetical protein